MTIYLDVVFFENLLLNFIILVATAIIGKCKIKKIKILLASIFGSSYAILNYIIKLSTFQNLLLKIFISSFMILIAFENKRIKVFFKNLIMFYLTSLTFGGAAFMLLFFISPQNIIYENGHFIGTYPIKVAIYGGILGFVIISIVSKIIKNRLSASSMLCQIDIVYNGKIAKLKTLIDSGNLLKEPISKEDVVIVEKSSLKEIVDEDILNNIDNIINGKWIGEMDDKVYNYKFKVIPFSSLGNENGVLLGFKPDYIKIYDEEEYVKNNIIIGIYNGKLSKSNLYTSLIGLNILKEGEKNECVTNV